MGDPSKHRKNHFGWSVLGYGMALGLTLILLQLARYRLLLLDHAQELYIGLIALLFTSVGIWAGQRLTRRPEAADLKSNTTLFGHTPDDILNRLQITPRELEVLRLIDQGLSNQEIAAQLYVSLNTVKTHIANLFAKLEAQRRTQALQKARDLGLLAPARPKV